MNNDVFLDALLEMPTTQQTRRSPLKWLSAMGFHIVIVAALIIVPLYTTGTIHLNEYHEIPVVAPPPPLAPPPAPCGRYSRSAYHAPKGKVNYMLQKLTAPTGDSEDRFPQAQITSAKQLLISVASKVCARGSDRRPDRRSPGRNRDVGATPPPAPRPVPK